jgi:hypothetical protein
MKNSEIIDVRCFTIGFDIPRLKYMKTERKKNLIIASIPT